MLTNIIFDFNSASDAPLYKQLVNHIRGEITNGNFTKNAKLPSSRKLAIDLKVSRFVTFSAYEQLVGEGYLLAESTSGTYVNSNLIESFSATVKRHRGPDWINKYKSRQCSDDHPENYKNKYNFSMGLTTNNRLPEDGWKRSWRNALSDPHTNLKQEPAGNSKLRNEIAVYLKRARNILCHPDDIIITTGVAESIRLIAKATEEFSPTTFCEYPGFHIAWHQFGKRNHTIKPVPVDHNGLVASLLPNNLTGEDKPYMLFCTPAHQMPLGHRLSSNRRSKVLQWAINNDAIILEDDYDSEFHYGTLPLPTLKSCDHHGNVIYLSSFSRSVSQNIKIGYIVATQKINVRLRELINREHAEPPLLMQSAMAHFIEQGFLDRHIERCQRYYDKLNQIMREELSALPKDIALSGLDSGIHAFLSFKEPPDALIKALNAKSFHLPLLSGIDGLKQMQFGFSLGYGHFEPVLLRTALKTLMSEILKLHS